MKGLFTYIYHENQLNVGKYSIHGFVCGSTVASLQGFPDWWMSINRWWLQPSLGNDNTGWQYVCTDSLKPPLCNLHRYYIIYIYYIFVFYLYIIYIYIYIIHVGRSCKLGCETPSSVKVYWRYPQIRSEDVSCHPGDQPLGREVLKIGLGLNAPKGNYKFLQPLTCKGHITTLLGTSISPEKSILKMIFLFPRWDMLISWRVYIPTNSSEHNFELNVSFTLKFSPKRVEVVTNRVK